MRNPTLPMFREPGRYYRCSIPSCSGDSSEEYDIPLCQEHILYVWSTVTDQMTKRGATGVELVRDHFDKLMAQADEADQTAAARRAVAIGHIYYLRIGDHIKVGYTSNLWQRLDQYPPTSILLAAHDGTRQDEGVLHSLFTAHRVAGREWYNPAPELMAHIAKMRAEHGAIDPRVFEAPKRPGKVMLRSRSGGNAKR